MTELHSSFYEDDSATIFHGDCLEVLATLEDGSVDSVVTDPPYGIVFMGRKWDDHVDGKTFQAWCQTWATECLRVLKPGGYILAFGGSRTWHRLASAVEDAGFEIRDSIAWLYGSGFPKSLDVSKAIDRMAGAEREVVGESRGGSALKMGGDNPRPWHDRQAERGGAYDVTIAATDDAKTWQGWGTALKPAFEPIVVGRKPLIGTVAQNVLQHGTGALNVDGCRVSGELEGDPNRFAKTDGGAFAEFSNAAPVVRSEGRWPTNVVLDSSTAEELDRQSGNRPGQGFYKEPGTTAAGGIRGGGPDRAATTLPYFLRRDNAYAGEEGGASRFFPVFRYEPKAPTSERPRDEALSHPTVKPLDLMCWLVRLVTPRGGTVLEPFAGSGTTAEACVIEGMNCIAIEREADYLPLIVQRLAKPIQPNMFGT